VPVKRGLSSVNSLHLLSGVDFHPRLISVDGLVLTPVIPEHPLNIGHKPDQRIYPETAQPDCPFDHVTQNRRRSLFAIEVISLAASTGSTKNIPTIKVSAIATLTPAPP